MDTIAAISTAPMNGGISVIRISGARAFEIADGFFKSEMGRMACSMQGYSCALGHAFDDDECLDECIMTVFRSPKSYTGEDLVEISCHGGIYVTRRVLRAALSRGARLAEPGEFTKRAFLNGKMNLSSAEAVIDIISAGGENELKYANSLHEGALSKRIGAITDKIVGLLGELDAWADFPEEDLPGVEPKKMLKAIRDIAGETEAFCKTYDYGRILRGGVNTVIAGKPNVGKSTLMNRLSGFERSIVSDIAGTTRDVIEENVSLGQVVLKLSDTAGMRNSDDKIEKIGVEIARKKLAEADLVLAVFDNSVPLDDEDNELLYNIMNKNTIAVINKSDCEPLLDRDKISSAIESCVEISASDGSGIDELIALIQEKYYCGDISVSSGIIANERQLSCAKAALSDLREAENAAIEGQTNDIITVLLDSAAEELLRLDGKSVSETVVNDIFSRFCVGK